MRKNVFIFTAIATAMAIFQACNYFNGSSPSVKLIPVKGGADFEYIDLEGKIVINPQFSAASVFHEGLALVRTNGDNPKWGYIGEDGKYVITANYKEATIFSEGKAWVVSENAAPALIDKSGKLITTIANADKVEIFKEGLAAYSIEDSAGAKWGFLNGEGKVAINPQFEYCGTFNEGMCPVRTFGNDKWGYIGKDGKITINYQFESAGNFYRKKAIVSAGGKFGVIDASGKYIINPQFDEILIDNGCFLIKQDGKYGWVDEKSKSIINPQFEEASPFGENSLAPVKIGKSYGYVDKEGKIVINPQFDIAFPYCGKMAMVSVGGKFGFIDIEGKYTINPQFDEPSGDFIMFSYGGGYSSFSQVETDYFDVSKVVNRINFENPEGLTLPLSFSDLMTKRNLTESNFVNDKSQVITEDIEVIKNVKINASVLVNPFQYEFNGWFGGGYQFHPETTINNILFIVKFESKPEDRIKKVKTALEKKLSTFTKQEKSTTDGTQFTEFVLGNKTIRLADENDQLLVYLQVDSK